MIKHLLKLKPLQIFLLLFIFISGNCFAQEKCIVNGYVTTSDDALGNVSITLYKDADKVNVKRVERGGKFTYQLDFGHDYLLEFAKKAFVSKRVRISTHVPQQVLDIDSRFPACVFSIELFRHFPGIDFSVFEQAIALIKYNKSTDLIETDFSYQSEIKAELKRINEEIKLREEAYLAEQETINVEFKKTIKEADKELKKQRYTQAKLLYNKALRLKPTESYPNKQIFKIKNLLLNRKSEH